MPRPRHDETTEQIETRRRREYDAEQKAANDPDELEEADIEDLSPATVARLAHQGHLFRFGVPAQSSRSHR